MLKVDTAFTKDVSGVWLKDSPNSDVHVYAMESQKVVVIGQNVNYNDDVQFSDLALVFKGDEVNLQYVGKDGKPETVAVDPRYVRATLLGLLNTIKKLSVND